MALTSPHPLRIPYAALLALALWLLCVNVLSIYSFTYGKQNFVLVLVLAALLGTAPFLAKRWRASLTMPKWVWVPVALLLFAPLAYNFVRYNTAPKTKDMLVDVALNTIAAEKAMWSGTNPYTTRTQLWHNVSKAPNVRVVDGVTTMYGFNYYYGYPYFPAMLISYSPFLRTLPEKPAIRFANLLLVVGCACGAALLAHRLANAQAAALVAFAATLGVWRWGFELFLFGVTDILIAAWLLGGMLALARGRLVLAGALLGVAQGCKLLPAPFFLIAVVIWLGPRRALPLVGAYAIAAAALILPWFLADPEAFISATILYYLTYHAPGDNTSLYWFLPAALKPWFPVAGALLLAAITALAIRLRAPQDHAQPLVIGCVLTLVFLAFNKMIHLNYLWAMYAPACAALAVAWHGAAAGNGEKERPG